MIPSAQSQAATPIAAIQGASSAAIQALLRELVAGLRPAVRVVGVVEEEPEPGLDPQLCCLTSGRRYPIFQDLGPSSTACALYAEGIVTACEAVRCDIAAGCDLVVLSKFGKLEVERSGLASAFAAAVEARTPILTSVAPKFDAAWTAFAAPLFVTLPPDLAAIRSWWDSVAPASPGVAAA